MQRMLGRRAGRLRFRRRFPVGRTASASRRRSLLSPAAEAGSAGVADRDGLAGKVVGPFVDRKRIIGRADAGPSVSLAVADGPESEAATSTMA